MPSCCLSTGIEGLDDILGGGLPKSAMYIVQGDSGVGKTTLCMQYLLNGIANGESCLYVTLSESAAELARVAASHGWSIDRLNIHELSAANAQLGPEDENTLFHPAEVELGERIQQLIEEVDRVKASRIVLDSCSELRLLAQTALRFRRQLLALKHHLVIKRRCTVVLVNSLSSIRDEQLLLLSLAHGVIILEQMLPDFGIERRRLAVLKLRGVKSRGGYHDYVIATGGLKVFPRLIAAEHRLDFRSEIVQSGVRGLDALLGGGLTRGTSTLFMGPAGTGKSALAMQYAAAAAERGEHSAIFLFDESLATAVARSQSLGLDLEPHLRSGRIAIRQIDPVELTLGEFVYEVRRLVEREGTRVVVLDSLNGYIQAMPSERFLIAQLHELLTFLGQQGVSTLLLMAQHGLLSDSMLSPVDLSYLADTVVVLRYFEADGSVRKAISVIKRRVGPHEDTIREFQLSAQGLQIGAPLREFRGVLTGVPQYGGHVESSGPLKVKGTARDKE